VRERFGDKPIVREDMLQAFINRGMTMEQLESETLTQMCVACVLASPLPPNPPSRTDTPLIAPPAPTAPPPPSA